MPGRQLSWAAAGERGELPGLLKVLEQQPTHRTWQGKARFGSAGQAGVSYGTRTHLALLLAPGAVVDAHVHALYGTGCCAGVEIKPHKNTHDYQVVENLSFPILHPDWGVSGPVPGGCGGCGSSGSGGREPRQLWGQWQR